MSPHTDLFPQETQGVHRELGFPIHPEVMGKLLHLLRGSLACTPLVMMAAAKGPESPPLTSVQHLLIGS